MAIHTAIDSLPLMGSRPTMTTPARVDAGTLERCRERDLDALRALFEAYSDRVYSIALCTLDGDAAAAQDVTQHVFLRLMTRMDQFRGDAEFTTWLYRIVVNACADERRRRRRLIFFSERPRIVDVPDRRNTYDDVARGEIGEHVRRAISKLSPKIRMAVLLKYYEGLSYDEIAAVLGCTKGTVASRLNRGHKALARSLDHLRDEAGLETCATDDRGGA
jgi:RNA polymerase sigma-70 factor (ECF subfamily)